MCTRDNAHAESSSEQASAAASARHVRVGTFTRSACTRDVAVCVSMCACAHACVMHSHCVTNVSVRDAFERRRRERTRESRNARAAREQHESRQQSIHQGLDMKGRAHTGEPTHTRGHLAKDGLSERIRETSTSHPRRSASERGRHAEESWEITGASARACESRHAKSVKAPRSKRIHIALKEDVCTARMHCKPWRVVAKRRRSGAADRVLIDCC